MVTRSVMNPAVLPVTRSVMELTEGGVPPGPTPPATTNLAWVDINDSSTVTTSGSEITAVQDKVTPTVFYTPLAGGPDLANVGGVDVMDFGAGVGTMRNDSNFINRTLPITHHIVGRSVGNTGTAAVLFCGEAAAESNCQYHSSGSVRVNNGTATVTPIPFGTDWFVLQWTIAANGASSVYFNSPSFATWSGNVGTNNLGGLWLGSIAGGSSRWLGWIGEWVLQAGESQADRTAWFNYWTQKYAGVT